MKKQPKTGNKSLRKGVKPVNPSPERRGAKTSGIGASGISSCTDAGVESLLANLSHPLQQEIEKVRAIILDVDSNISEAVKWNSVSFRTTDFFATINIRAKDTVQLVFHTGAKVKATAKTGIDVSDPSGLCKWLAKDRCLVTLGSGAELNANRKAFEALIREWIRWV